MKRKTDNEMFDFKWRWKERDDRKKEREGIFVCGLKEITCCPCKGLDSSPNTRMVA